jgi:putative ABC transport system ATP-binding protein
MFIAVFSTRASLTVQIENVARYVDFDAALGLPYGSKKQTVEREALRIPEISVAEGWAQSIGVIVREDGSESGELEIVGLPYDAATIDPLMIEGRWLEASDTSKIVINDDLIDEESGIGIGSEITLKIGNRERTYQVVGVTSKHLSGSRIYMEYGSFGQLTNRPNQVDTIRVRGNLETIGSNAEQDVIAFQLENRFENASLSKSSSITRNAIFGDFTDVFDLILVVLMIMAGLLALVGGLGLTGTLGINVLERTREIGVLRAVGASNVSVRQVIVIEGVVVGLISWVLGALLSGPSGRALAGAVVNAVMQADVSYTYSFWGLLLWLVVVGFIAVFSSLAFWNKSGSNGSGAGKYKANGHLIAFNQVSKIYETSAGSFTALRDLDLRIDKGEFVSIVGKSGSGKTTLINMLTGIDRPSDGEIYVSGAAVHELNEGEIAVWRGKNVGVVFQFFQLLPTLSVLENVRLPMDFGGAFDRQERNDRAMHLLELVGIEEQADALPAKLSGGQQQRAAIARALANDPPIIATDEPTGNLDSHSSNKIIRLFEDLVSRGTTILMVTHDDELAGRAMRTIRLADGKVVL